MKKQKKPIIPILIVAVLLGGVAFMNKPTSSAGPEEKAPDVKPDDQKTVGSEVKAQLKEAGTPKVIDKSAKSGPTPSTGPSSPGGPPKGAHGPGGRPGMNSDVPTILKVKIAPMKPKPNDSSTSTQWYTKDSARNLPPKQ